MAKPPTILAIGNAIVDIIAPVEDSFLAAHGIEKGGMRLLDDAAQSARLYDALAATTPIEVSGGSAANTAVGIVACGGEAGFIGAVGDDALGDSFTRDITGAGVVFAPAVKAGARSGSSIILVTPDAERSMNTHLGAAALLTPEDISAHAAEIIAANTVYLEGYIFDMPQGAACAGRLAEIAAGGNTAIALSLADAWCVERHYDSMRGFIAEHTALLFGNAGEMEILTGRKGDAMIEAAAALAGEVVITKSADGAVILAGGKTHAIPARRDIDVVDTTGAGDLFAAGYLHAREQGGDAAEAARCGVAAASAIITHYGARPRRDFREIFHA